MEWDPSCPIVPFGMGWDNPKCTTPNTVSTVHPVPFGMGWDGMGLSQVYHPQHSLYCPSCPIWDGMGWDGIIPSVPPPTQSLLSILSKSLNLIALFQTVMGKGCSRVHCGTTMRACRYCAHACSVLKEKEASLSCNTEKDRHTHLNTRTAGICSNCGVYGD